MAGVGPGAIGDDYKASLNSYIHAYLIDEGLLDIANSFKTNSGAQFNEDLISRASTRRQNGGDAEDSRDEANNRMKAQGNATGDIALFDWWCIYWDLHSGSTRGATTNYLNAQTQARIRQQQMMQQPGMMNNHFPQFAGRMMQQGQMNMAKQAIANNGRMNAMQPNIRPQQPMAGAAPREGNEADLTGQQRGSSPAGENGGPSPKRQRMDGPGFQQQQMVANGPNGPQANGNMGSLNTPFDPNPMSPASFKANIPGPGSNVRAYSANLMSQQRANMERASNAPGGPNESPMMAGQDGQFAQGDMFPNGQPNPGMRAQMPVNNMQQQGGVNQGGALADYQMQLMLLEQQNKRRLMMARQEQDVAGSQLNGGQGGIAPNMSPRQNSRTGNTPPGQDGGRQGTPKMGQDPMLQMGVRNSPIPGNMNPGQLGPDGFQLLPSFQNGGRPPNGMPAGPVAANQMEMMRRLQQSGQMNGQMMNPQMNGQMNGQMMNGQMNGQFQMPPQMMQNPMMGGQPDQRTSMPPPQVPGPGANGRIGPGSPQQPPAPPTPSQANKTNPKAKKEKETKKKPTKKNTTTTGATPTADGEGLDDVPPPTPSTPKNAASNLIKGPAPQVPNNQPQTMPQQNQSVNVSAAQNNNHAMMPPPFSMIDTSGMSNPDLSIFENNMDLNFDEPNDLGFDFESFLHDEPGMDFTFDSNFDQGLGGLETGENV